MRFGIDVSEWQGSIDWGKVRAAGVEFAMIRVGYGLGHQDRFFARNWAGAKAAGVARGGYLWFRPSQPAEAQAHLLAVATTDAELAPWCDFEDLDGVYAAAAFGRLAEFVAALTAAAKATPVIYTGPSFWVSYWYRRADWARMPLAIAEYGVAAPTIPPPWSSYAFWQHSSVGHVPGIAGPVDLDWAAVAQLITAAGTNPKEHPLAHLNAPIVAIVDTPTGNGYWEIGADGGLFPYGDAAGAIDLATNPLPSQRLAAPIIGATCTPSGKGLRLAGADGGVFCLGDAAFLGAVTG